MNTLRLLAGSTLVLALAAGCGGYEGPLPTDANGQATSGAGSGVDGLQSAPLPTEGATSAPTTATSRPGSTASAPGNSTGATSCTMIGRISSIGFKASKKIRSSVNSFRVTLTQGALSRTAWTPADPAHPHGMPLVPGVVIYTDDGTYGFIMGGDGDHPTALPGAWSAKKKATFLIEGLAGDGRSIYQQSRTFMFETSYPNGKACDKTPALHFFTELTKADQIAGLT